MSKKIKKEEKVQNIFDLDTEKIKKEAQKNTKEINILKDCKTFCKKYGNKDLKTYGIHTLKNVCDEGNGLLNMYFITENIGKVDTTIIMQLQYITMNATYTLNIKQMENTRQSTVTLREKLNTTIHSATKLEKDAMYTAKELKDMKNDIKGIITTILAIVLTFSIIPTALTAIEKLPIDYVLPFVSSIIIFGMFMAIFIYSIYEDRIKWSTWLILIISIIICICLWTNTIFGFIKIGNNIENKNENLIEEKVEKEL